MVIRFLVIGLNLGETEPEEVETPEVEIDESPCLFIDRSFPSVVLPASLKNLSKESLVRAVLQKLVLLVIMGSKKLDKSISLWNRVRVNICM